MSGGPLRNHPVAFCTLLAAAATPHAACAATVLCEGTVVGTRLIDSATAALPPPCFPPPRTQFKDVGKGWYNLAEARQDTYDFSKLKRLLVSGRLSYDA